MHPPASVSAHSDPALPSLQPGIRLLDLDEGLREALHALVLDHHLLHDGPVYWVDAHGHATTGPLARLVPSRRMLDRIHIARGFTPFQHHTIVDTLTTLVDADTSLVVVPAVDHQYREDNLIRDEPHRMLQGVLERLQSIARTHDLPVLVTQHTPDDDLGTTVSAVADEHIRCEQTRYGPRFSADGFETLVYPAGRGWYQTTIAYWHEVLAARRRAHHAMGVAYGAD